MEHPALYWRALELCHDLQPIARQIENHNCCNGLELWSSSRAFVRAVAIGRIDEALGKVARSIACLDIAVVERILRKTALHESYRRLRELGRMLEAVRRPAVGTA